MAICNDCRHFVAEACRHDAGRTATVFYAEACGLFLARLPAAAPAPAPMAAERCPACGGDHVTTAYGWCACWRCSHVWRGCV